MKSRAFSSSSRLADSPTLQTYVSAAHPVTDCAMLWICVSAADQAIQNAACVWFPSIHHDSGEHISEYSVD